MSAPKVRESGGIVYIDRAPHSLQEPVHTITVYSRNVYGTYKIYPFDGPALQFAALLGVRTFNNRQLAQIEAMGITVASVEDPVGRSIIRTAGVES